MSRVQLALNVADLDDGVDFYTKLFGTEPAKVRPGYANFAIAEPPLKLVLIEGHGEPGTLNHLGVEVESTDEVGGRPGPAGRRGAGHRDRGRGRVLLRGAGQGVGRRARRRAVGDLHRARRRRDAAGRAAHRRARGDGRAVLRRRAPESGRAAAADRPCDRSTSRGRRRPKRVGTALLVAIVVGSGIAAQRLSPDDVGLQLLENSIATGAGLVALILALRAGLRRALQPGRHPRRPHPRRHHDARRAASTSSPRSSAACLGRDRRQPHVRPPRRRRLDARPARRRRCGWARSSPPSGCCS